MRDYITKSIPTIVLMVLLVILQFIPSSVSMIVTLVVVLGYFIYQFYLIHKQRQKEIVLNMFEFSVVLFLYVLVVEVIL